VKLKTKGKTINEIGGSSFNDDWPAVGHYQFLVNGIEVNPERVQSCIVVQLEVVTGEVPGQEGKTPTMMLWYDPSHEKWGESAMDRITRFFWAVGLIEEDAESNVEENDAIGKTFVGKVVTQMRKDKHTGKREERIGIEDGAYWRCGHPDIANLFSVDEKVVADAAKAATVESKVDKDEEDLSDL
jgi:hypothetical protein